MITQKKSAGKREFFLAVCIVCLIVVIASVLGGIFKNSLIGDISGLLLFCVYGYFVLVRYGAVYTYTVTDSAIRVNRQIGARNKEAELTKDDIIKITHKKPKAKVTYNFSRFIIKRSGVLYILFMNGNDRMAAIVEADRELRDALSKLSGID